MMKKTEEDPIPRVIGDIDDPRRMMLTREELEWALEVKELIENTPELDNLPDMMYAQIAIITKGNHEDAFRRAWLLQEFRKEYNILDTFEEGLQMVTKLVEILPLMLLSFSFSPSEGTFVVVNDMCKLNTTVLNTPRRVRMWMASSYYIHSALSADVASIRRGCIAVVECEGMDWTKKQDFKLLQAMFSQLLTVYPFTGEFRGFHTGTIFNIMASTLRRILPRHLKSMVQTGHTCEGRLDTFYLVPDVLSANQRLISRVTSALQMRYENERTFSLEPHQE
ncbi:expressed unknown protein [Seminavis robusta]|uniref:CRAL-TRIO domain-containing protein n=1 Tax=Seminavis robusta TaxID=568900 RepID=A0A9N8DZ16_9STRA|nr:expressed unknown protein [Seminavis robusta]|eukprot:Sro489_g153320.1 n/a (280) ;mRNA; f:44570-45409